MEKQFILGVGCQKGGTTWIYDQLNKIEKVDFGFKKEYHLFDTLYIDHEKKFKKQVINESTSQLVVNYYKHVYLNLAERFPAKQNWESFKYL